MSNNKICLIGTYFGDFPNYFSLWLKCCEKNSNIDFLIFTDQEKETTCSNIKIIKTSLSNIKNRASEILGFECSLERPYKMCDYKPLYGLIFEEYLFTYDYWGHFDFDLMFGNLKYFFDKYDLYKYDRFNALGHLSLYKNTREVNERYLLYKDYRKVFQSDKSFVFDEMPGMTALYLKHKYPFFTKRIFVDIASIYDRFRIINEYSLDTKAKNYKNQIFFWENGKCYHAYYVNDELFKTEYQYIHFKKRPNFTVNFDIGKTNAFYITKYGFIPKTGEVTLDLINKYNPYRGLLYEKGELLTFKLQKYIHSIKRKLIKGN